MSTRVQNNGPMDLPTPQTQGCPPSANPRFINRIAAQWEVGYDEEEAYGRARSIPAAGPYRGSYASSRCDRRLHYEMTLVPCDFPKCNEGQIERLATPDEVDNGCELGVAFDQCPKCEGRAVIDLPKSNPPTLADKYRFHVGKIIHALVEESEGVAIPEGEPEVVVDLNVIGIPGSAHADFVTYTELGEPDDVVEHKSVSGYPYKMASTTFKGPPEGPKSGAILQGAMVAVALNAKRVVVTNWSLENLSPTMADTQTSESDLGRFAAEWEYDVDDLRDIVEYERKRIARVLRYAEAGRLPARELHDDEVPAGAIIDDPNRSTWKVTIDGNVTAMGKMWHGNFCEYCPQKARCLADGA